MANVIDSLNIGGNTGVFSLPYAVCDTAADDAAKTVTVENFSLETGAMVVVKFTNANSVDNPTLNVNGTGAKSIMRYGTTNAGTSTTISGWVAGAITTFIYDGINWVREYWNNTTYTNVSLGQGYATCSTAADTAAKTASLSSYKLVTGGIVAVRFSYDVPANATLNINSTGAKSIYYNNTKITAGVIKAGDTATFVYSSYYRLIAIDKGPTVTASRALVSDSNGKVSASAVTATELGYLDGVTSAIQTQLNDKAAKSVAVSATLSASSWSGSGPYTYTLTASGVTASVNGAIGLSPTATNAQYDAAALAHIRITAQSANSITLTATGTKPTVDIPVVVIIQG